MVELDRYPRRTVNTGVVVREKGRIARSKGGPERRGSHGISDQRRAATNRGPIVNLSGAAHGDQADRTACSRVRSCSAIASRQYD